MQRVLPEPPYRVDGPNNLWHLDGRSQHPPHSAMPFSFLQQQFPDSDPNVENR